MFTVKTPRGTLTYSRPAIFAVVNASPDSFSDPSQTRDLKSRLTRLEEVIREGADVIDIGGQSAITGVPEIDPLEEIERVSPVLEQARRSFRGAISIDTYKPDVARHVLANGADIINDVSGLAFPETAEAVASSGASYVLMHNRGRPKQRLTSSDLYTNVVDDVLQFFDEKLSLLQRLGLRENQIILDPGPDFSKTPRQTLDVLHHVDRITTLGFPVLLALSRKDFIGVVTNRPPDERDGGTFGALSRMIDKSPNCLLRVHDVGRTKDFLDVRDAIDDPALVEPDALLPVDLRRTRNQSS